MAKSARQQQQQDMQRQGVLSRIEQALDRAQEYAPLVLQVVDGLVSILHVRRGRMAGRARVGGPENAFASPGSLDHPGLNELHRAIVNANMQALAASLEAACCTDPDFAGEAPEGGEQQQPQGQQQAQDSPERARQDARAEKTDPKAGQAPQGGQGAQAGQEGQPQGEEANRAPRGGSRARAGDQAREAQQEGQESVAVGGVQESTPEAAHAGNPTGGVPGAHPGDPDEPGKAAEGSTPGQQQEPATPARRARRRAGGEE